MFSRTLKARVSSPINRGSRQAPVDRAPTKDERERIQPKLVLRYPHHDELAAGRPREGCPATKPRPLYMFLPVEAPLTFCISSDALSFIAMKLRFRHVSRAPQ